MLVQSLLFSVQTSGVSINGSPVEPRGYKGQRHLG